MVEFFVDAAFAELSEEFDALKWRVTGRVVWAAKSTELTATATHGVGYGVLALWRVRPDAADAFAKASVLNAAASVREEAGCIAFGVIRSTAVAANFALIEVFGSKRDFEAHLTTAHFAQFSRQVSSSYIGDRKQTLKGPSHWH